MRSGPALGVLALCVLALGVLAALAGCDRSDPPPPASTARAAAVPGGSARGAPVATASPAATQFLPATSACAETEAVVFSCRIRDGRALSVCIQRDERGREFAQYRFGEADAPPELAWPTRYAQPGMKWASAPYSGGGEVQLSFARDDVRYVIYSRVVRTNFEAGEPNDPEFSDGAYVYRGDRRISHLACDGEAERPIEVGMAERFAERQDELFTD